MDVVAIDLAARFSASCTLGPGLRLLGWDAPLMDSHVEWLDEVVDEFIIRSLPLGSEGDREVFLVVEDVPLSLPFTAKVKAALQLQGEIAHQARVRGLLDNVFFVQPMIWQRHFEGVWRGKEPAQLEAAKRLGFEPPNLLEMHGDLFQSLKGKERQTVRNAIKKQQTDIVAAYLIAVWAQETYAEHGTLEVKNVIKYLGKWN